MGGVSKSRPPAKTYPTRGNGAGDCERGRALPYRAQAGAGRRVLIVEDDADIREALALTLARVVAIEVGTAPMARTGLEQLQNGPSILI